jgi:hypothetical protein
MPQKDSRFTPDKPKRDPRFIPDTIDESTEERDPGLLRKGWAAISTPIADIRGNPAIRQATDEFAKEHPVIGGGANFLADMVSGLSSPLNLAFAGLGAGEVVAAKYGLPAIAKGLQYGRQGLSLPVAYEGAENIYGGATEGNWAQGIGGGLELLGGLAGIRPGGHVPKVKLNITKPSVKPTISEVPESAWFDIEHGPEATKSTGEQLSLPIRPAVNPAVSKPVIEPLKTEPQGIETKPVFTSIDALLTTPEEVHTAFNDGKINQEHALKLLEKIYKAEQKAAAKQVKPPVAKTKTGKVIEPTYVFGKEQVNPEFIEKAKQQGYKFQGLDDNGDWKFKKTTEPPAPVSMAGIQMTDTPVIEPVVSKPVIESTPPIEPTPVKSTPFTESVLASEPKVQVPKLGIPEVVELMRSGQVKNMAGLQKELGVNFNLTRVIWNKAKDVIGPKEYGEIQTARKIGGVTELPIKQPGVGPVPVKPIEAPIEAPVAAAPEVSTGKAVVPKEKVTPDFIRNARAQGFEYDSLTENGDFVFREAPPVFEAPPELVNEPAPKVTKPAKVKTSSIGIPITEAGSADLNGMVNDLRAMRRRKGINQYTEQEAITYRGLLESIKNHPDLPPDMKAAWDVVTSPPEPVVTTPTVETPVTPVTPTKITPKTAAETWAARVAELDAANAPDIEYQSILSTAAKNPLKEGQTWRGKVLKFIELAGKKQAEADKPTGFGSRFKGEKGEVLIRQGKPEKFLHDFPIGEIVVVKSAQAIPRNVKKLFDAGFRFEGKNEAGDFRFKKTETTTKAPILEEEVGKQRPTKQGARGELGAIQDAKKSSIVAEVFNLPRGIMASWDLSAPLRQGLPLIHKKEFWTALNPMMKSWASEEGFQASQAAIAERPLFKKRFDDLGNKLPSFADDAGLKLTDLTDLSKREEAIMSTWAEKVPVVRASNRAYTAFLNNLRADVFENLIKNADILGSNTKGNLPLARALADFVNTASGRGKLSVDIPDRFQKLFGGKTELSLESSAVLLNTGLFAPRLIASRVKILNPAYYIMATPMVRKEALKSLFAITAVGNSVLQLAKMAGAEVETDPNNSDFGKAKIGNTRLDPWAGFQQYVVAANRLIRPTFARVPGLEEGTDTGAVPLDLATGFMGKGGQTVSSSTSGRKYDLWNERPGPFDPSPATIATRFLRGKTHPVINFGWALLTGKKEMSGQKMNFKTMNPMENAIAQRFIPILMQDVYQLAKESPELLPLAIPAALGMGVQTYGGVK